MADREKPQRGFQPLKGIIGEILDQYRLGGRPDPSRVWQIWERAVGPALARNARPAAVKKGMLLVHVNSSAWLQELHFQKAALIARINQEAGEVLVEDIRFKIGPLRPINTGNGR